MGVSLVPYDEYVKRMIKTHPRQKRWGLYEMIKYHQEASVCFVHVFEIRLPLYTRGETSTPPSNNRRAMLCYGVWQIKRQTWGWRIRSWWDLSRWKMMERGKKSYWSLALLIYVFSSSRCPYSTTNIDEEVDQSNSLSYFYRKELNSTDPSLTKRKRKKNGLGPRHPFLLRRKAGLGYKNPSTG